MTHSNLIATSSLVAMFVPERERERERERENNRHYATRQQVTNERQQLVTPKLTILTTTQTQLKWVVRVTNQNKHLD